MAAVEDMLLEQARRQLSDQGAQFDQLRTRTAGVLSAAGIVATFSGIGNANRGFLVPAVIAFALVALVSVVILWPITMDFAVKLKEPIDSLRADADIDHQREAFSLAWRIEDQREKNRGRLSSRRIWFSVQCVALGLEVILGTVARIVR